MSVSSRSQRPVTEAERRRLEGLLAITRILAAGNPFEQVEAQILAAIRISLGGEVCELWRPDEDSQALRLTTTDHADSSAAGDFARQSQEYGFVRGEGLPGRVWRSKRPEWIDNPGADERIVRSSEVQAAAFRAALAFPLLAAGEVCGVVTVFRQTHLDVDDLLLLMMNTLGSQIGQYIWRERMESELLRRQDELSDFVENAAIGLHWVGPDGTILWANRTELEMLGYQRDEYIGHHIAEFHVDRPVIDDILQRLANKESLSDYESRLRCKDGSIIDVAINSNVLWDDNRFVHTRCFTRDITQVKRAEEKRRVAEQQFTSFMEHLPGAAWMKDADGRYVYANQFAQRIFSTPKDKLYGRDDREVFPPETARQFRENDRRVIESRQGIQTIEYLRHDDGIVHESIVSKFPIFDAEGRICYVAGIAIDITQQRQIERELQEAEERNRATFNEKLHLAAIVENSHDAIITETLDGTILSWNKAAERLYGYSADEMIGNSSSRILLDDRRQELQEIVARLQNGQPVAHFETVHRNRRGQLIDVSLSVSPMFDERQQLVACSVVSHDVSVTKQTQDALRRSEATLRSFCDNSPVLMGIVELVDDDILHIYDNPATAAFFGLPPHETAGRRASQLGAPPDAIRHWREQYLASQQNGAPVRFEYEHRGSPGSTWLSATVSFIDYAPTGAARFCYVAEDVTPRKVAEQRMRAEMELRRAIENAVPDGIAACDLSGRQVYVNSALCQMLGWSEQELIGAVPPYKYWPAEELENIAAAFQQTLRGEAPSEGFPLRFMRKNGERIDVLVRVGPIASASATRGWLASVTDITMRTRAEQALRASEERLRFTLQAAAVGAWDWNVQTGEVKWSDNLEALHGRPPGSFGGSIEDVINEVFPDDRPKVHRAIQAALSGGATFEVEYRYRRPDGSLGWLHGQGKAMLDDHGRPVRMAGICMDVTQRRRADEASRLLAELGVILATSLDSESNLPDVAHLLVPALGDWCIIDLLAEDQSLLPPVIVHTDPNKVAIARSLRHRYPPRLEASFGLGAVLRSGKAELHSEITDAQLRQTAFDDEYYEAVRQLGVKSSLTVPLVARGRTLGAITLVSAESHRKYSSDDLLLAQELATRCALAIDNTRLYREAHREIEERREAEEMLRSAREAAEAANRAKSEFLANISHEIRTPMAAILGYADLLGRHLQDAEKLQSVEIIRRNGRFLLEILNDVLDLSRIEAGRMEIERQRFCPHELFYDVHQLMEVPARDKNLPLQLEFLGAMPETIECDPTRLKQIAVNLVGNAIKFTERGSVRMVVQVLYERELLRLDVIDTGIGLSQDQLDRLFQPFTQADSSVTRRFGGSGVGLAISKRLAEMLGGQIEVTSEAGQGSTFSVAISTGSLQNVPRVEPKATPQELDTSDDVAGLLVDCHVLIVDDRREVRNLVQRCIEDAGGIVETASHGEDALARVAQAALSRPFEAILMDMQMPVMDGYQAVHRLRAAGFELPIIALTAHAMQGDREKCLAAGCDDYISKPIHRRDLVERVRQAVRTPLEELQRRRSASHSRGTMRSKPSASRITTAHGAQHEAPTAGELPLRILLVDDSQEICKMMSLLLSTRGYQVHATQSGRDALRAAASFEPHVVLLDLTLPDMSGYEVAGRLRELDELRGAVLISLSGRSGPEVIARSQAAGFDHHVVKPADLEELELLFPRASGR